MFPLGFYHGIDLCDIIIFGYIDIDIIDRLIDSLNQVRDFSNHCTWFFLCHCCKFWTNYENTNVGRTIFFIHPCLADTKVFCGSSLCHSVEVTGKTICNLSVLIDYLLCD